MREIKFRAWDYSKKIFLPTKTYAILSVTEFVATGIMLTDFEEYREGEYFYPHSQVINQYTGLKDKNGKEIYEGDVVNINEAKRNYIVKFHNGCFKLFHADPKLNYMLWGTIERVSELLWSFKVIGNIYENPELLKND